MYHPALFFHKYLKLHDQYNEQLEEDLTEVFVFLFQLALDVFAPVEVVFAYIPIRIGHHAPKL